RQVVVEDRFTPLLRLPGVRPAAGRVDAGVGHPQRRFVVHFDVRRALHRRPDHVMGALGAAVCVRRAGGLVADATLLGRRSSFCRCDCQKPESLPLANGSAPVMPSQLSGISTGPGFSSRGGFGSVGLASLASCGGSASLGSSASLASSVLIFLPLPGEPPLLIFTFVPWMMTPLESILMKPPSALRVISLASTTIFSPTSRWNSLATPSP